MIGRMNFIEGCRAQFTDGSCCRLLTNILNAVIVTGNHLRVVSGRHIRVNVQ